MSYSLEIVDKSGTIVEQYKGEEAYFFGYDALPSGDLQLDQLVALVSWNSKGCPTIVSYMGVTVKPH